MNKQLQQRIGQLIGKDYFKLEFGCKVITVDEENEPVKEEEVFFVQKTDEDDGDIWADVIANRIDIFGKRFKVYLEERYINEILGTEPTLQDVLLAVKDTAIVRLYSEGLTLEYGGTKIMYDLTKSLFNQTDEVKQQLLELMS